MSSSRRHSSAPLGEDDDDTRGAVVTAADRSEVMKNYNRRHQKGGDVDKAKKEEAASIMALQRKPHCGEATNNGVQAAPLNEMMNGPVPAGER